MPGFQSILFFLVVLYIAVSTNPDEESFRRFAGSRIRRQEKVQCSESGICVHGGGFSRILEPFNTDSKRVLGFQIADGSPRLYFRGTDCVFFTVVHWTSPLSGAYLGILNAWIALPQPKALRDVVVVSREQLARLLPATGLWQGRNEELPPTERVLGIVYTIFFSALALSSPRVRNGLLWSRTSARRGRLWTTAISLFAHRTWYSTARSVLVVLFCTSSLVEAVGKSAFVELLGCSALGAIVATAIAGSETSQFYLGPVTPYSILVALCMVVLDSRVKIRWLVFSNLSVSPFDALMASVSVELIEGGLQGGLKGAEGGLIAAVAALSSWLFARVGLLR
mmetsp:Transcript_23810/g.93607  ORF Transcript_23810/g.93607 Transcript_23810/m.93607 type:complete len:338 (-) Transcript_23810:792-1805(-)